MAPAGFALVIFQKESSIFAWPGWIFDTPIYVSYFVGTIDVPHLHVN
jgi:hypothetical protein